MDWEWDELVPLEESESVFNKMDEDLDYAFALSLQKEYKEKIETEKSSQKSDSFFNKMDEDLDYAFALSLQEEYKEKVETEKSSQKISESCSSKSASKTLGIVDEQWEFIDPTPDIHALFLQYNGKFFYGKLEGVEVKWSPRMTLCAGVCSYEGRGGLCSVRLSLPLLKLRPRRDLVETLLHEMIHAYLFVTANNKDHDAHGPEFLKHMNRINKETGTKISVYHSFHDEVDLYRKHWWKCNGPCQKRKPFFGLVKRAVNRAPGPRDFWFTQHQSSCGGTFIKIKEPEDHKKKVLKRKPMKDSSNESPNITKFMKTSVSEQGNSHSSSVSLKDKAGLNSDGVKSILAKEDNVVQMLEGTSNSSKEISIIPFKGQGFQLGSSSSVAPKSFLAQIRQELKSSNNKYQPHQKSQQSEKLLNVDNKILKNVVSKNSGAASTSSVSQNHSKINKSSNFVQSSMESFVRSPSMKEKSNKDSQSGALNSNDRNSLMVNCPVCFESFTSLKINAHLDSCLLKF